MAEPGSPEVPGQHIATNPAAILARSDWVAVTLHELRGAKEA